MEPGADNAGGSDSRRRDPRLIVAAIAVVFVVLVTIAVVVGRSPAHHRRVVAPRATVAPDVAFVDVRGLVVRTGRSGREMVVAPGTVAAPRWSASGDLLAYRADAAVWVVHADGTGRTRLGGNAGPNYLSETYAWSPTVDALAVIDGAGVNVWWFPDAGRARVPIAPEAGGVEPSAQSIAWSSDGHTLAISMQRYAHSGPGAPQASIWIVPGVCPTTAPLSCAKHAAMKRIFVGGRDQYPLFLAAFAFDDRYVLFWPDEIGSGSVAMDGLPLDAVPVAGGGAAPIATTLVRNAWVRPAPDRAHLLMVRSSGRAVTDRRAVEGCDGPSSCRALAPGNDVQTLDPAWSPSGAQIAFVREEHGSYAPPVGRDVTPLDYWGPKYRGRRLWIADADGAHGREVVAAGGGVADPQFSPDGRAIVFVRDARVWQINLDTQRVTALTGSLRSDGSCRIQTCLPDTQPYETTSRWSDVYAVKFPASNS